MAMSYMEFSAMLFLGGLAVVVVVLVRHMLTERRRSRLQDGGSFRAAFFMAAGPVSAVSLRVLGAGSCGLSGIFLLLRYKKPMPMT